MEIAELLQVPALAATTWSIDVRAVGGESLVSHQPDQRLRTASVAKLFVLTELARRIEDGSIDAAELVSKRSVEPVGDSGIWQHLDANTLTIDDAARLVGTHSDNLATNVLIARLGLEQIQATARTLASEHTQLLDIVRDVRTEEHPETLSEGTACDWANFMQRLANDPGPAAQRVLAWLAHSADLSMVANTFDLDPLSHGSDPTADVRVWNKTGTDPGVRADVGIVAGPRQQLAYAVLCNWEASASESPDTRRAVYAAMRAIGRHLESLT